MELIKDYDCTIHYHSRKVNVVVAALSLMSVGSLSCMHFARIENFCEMKKMKLMFDVSPENARLAHFSIWSTFIDQIRAGKDLDEFLVSKKKLVEDSLTYDFRFGVDGMLMFGARMCVSNDYDLRRSILEEGHSSAYAMHPESNKLYRNLQEKFW